MWFWRIKICHLRGSKFESKYSTKVLSQLLLQFAKMNFSEGCTVCSYSIQSHPLVVLSRSHFTEHSLWVLLTGHCNDFLYYMFIHYKNKCEFAFELITSLSSPRPGCVNDGAAGRSAIAGVCNYFVSLPVRGSFPLQRRKH